MNVAVGQTGQYVRIQLVERGVLSLAEVEVFGESVCLSPSVALVQPVDNTIQSEITVKATACLDAVTHAGWGVGVSVDGVMLAQLFGDTSFEVSIPGISQTDGHSVTVEIIDAMGIPQSGLNTQDQSTGIGVGEYYVAIGDSITYGYFDDFSGDNVSQDGRNNSQGFTPRLSDLLTSNRGYPVVVMHEGIGGWTSAQALDTFPDVLQRHPDANAVLMRYGTNDAGGAFPIPSGLNTTAGDAEYIGTYKANMQQLIDLASAKGLKSYLAEVPAVQVTKQSYVNRLIEYNNVVAQLIIENNIEINPGTAFTSPPFYSYFEDNINNSGASEFFDSLHPNGEGYRSMATMWLQSLTSAP